MKRLITVVLVIVLMVMTGCAMGTSLVGKKCPSGILHGGYYNEFTIGHSDILKFDALTGIHYIIMETDAEYIISGTVDLGDGWFVNKPNKKKFIGSVAVALMDEDFIVVLHISSEDMIIGYNSKVADKLTVALFKNEEIDFKIQIKKKHVDASQFRYISFGISPLYYSN